MSKTKAMTCSLIITTYNWPAALELVLKSALRQSETPDEIIIADDGSTDETRELVERYSAQSPIPVLHSWQEDRGFQLAASRNRAIALSKCAYIVMIDGDMILHRHFIKDHRASAQHNQFIQGSRVLLTQEISKHLLSTKHIRINFFAKGLINRMNAIHNGTISLIFSKQTSTFKGIRGCNMSFFRADCIHANGFNEDFTGWGREDSEFVARLYNNKILRHSLKFRAIAYHIWHKESSRAHLSSNDQLLDFAIEHKIKRCTNGIDKYLND